MCYMYCALHSIVSLLSKPVTPPPSHNLDSLPEGFGGFSGRRSLIMWKDKKWTYTILAILMPVQF